MEILMVFIAVFIALQMQESRKNRGTDDFRPSPKQAEEERKRVEYFARKQKRKDELANLKRIENHKQEIAAFERAYFGE